MKPELTPELKVRFFALYYGQVVVVESDSRLYPIREVNGVSLQLMDCSPKHLLLRSVKEIADEEAIEVAKMGGYEISFAMPAVDVRKHLLQQITNDSRWTTIGSHHIDYLRSIGIALPWMGYSVEELVEFGWVRLVS